MKLKEAIRQADALRPNTIADEIKAGWLYELEGKLAETREDAPPPLRTWPNDMVLGMPPPVDNVYVAYLLAMIDYANEESDRYANDMTVFQAAYTEAIAWWRRHHEPRCKGPMQVF